MRTSTEGVVLRTMEFGEADLIVTYATPDLGVIQAFARSARKIKSRFGSSLEPVTHVRISTLGKEGASLPRLVQSDIIYPFCGLREELSSLTQVAEVFRVFQRFAPRREGRPRKFGLLLATLHSMESAERHEFLGLVFLVKLLWMSGYGPRMDTCGRCHRAVPPEVARDFHPSAGSIICPSCGGRSPGALNVSAPLAGFFRDARALKLTELLRKEGLEEMLTEARILLDAHCRHLDAVHRS